MKKIINILRNSKFHYIIALIFEKFQMEGFTISYSQGGEDLIIKKLLGNKKKGVYVDIGCNNPIQKSNTFKLYLNGWTGICVDGNKSLTDRFKKIRPKDIVLNEIVSDESKEMTFYNHLDNHEYSTVVKIEQPSINIKKSVIISTTLNKLFDKYIANSKIDLLCIDVEGHDFEVLKGLDYTKYRPEIICIECGGTLQNLLNNEMVTFLIKQSYEVAASCSENVYFRNKAS